MVTSNVCCPQSLDCVGVIGALSNTTTVDEMDNKPPTCFLVRRDL